MVESQRQEAFVDRMIREACERGEFNDLPGKGKPIPGVGTVDTEGWWIRSWVERNRSQDAPSSDEDDHRL
ncbi:MAG: DnaJ family domain-containing protein [Acidimicrobiia bacterium]